MSIEVEETIKRIQSHKGVKGVLIMNHEGIPIRSNFSPDDTETYASIVSEVSISSYLPFTASLINVKYLEIYT